MFKDAELIMFILLDWQVMHEMIILNISNYYCQIAWLIDSYTCYIINITKSVYNQMIRLLETIMTPCDIEQLFMFSQTTHTKLYHLILITTIFSRLFLKLVLNIRSKHWSPQDFIWTLLKTKLLSIKALNCIDRNINKKAISQKSNKWFFENCFVCGGIDTTLRVKMALWHFIITYCTKTSAWFIYIYALIYYNLNAILSHLSENINILNPDIFLPIAFQYCTYKSVS